MKLTDKLNGDKGMVVKPKYVYTGSHIKCELQAYPFTRRFISVFDFIV
jgi:hypothetical protein